MKVVICSDLHIDAKTAGYDRYEDCKKALSQAVEHAIQVKARYFIFLGDLTDPDSPNIIRCMRAASEAAQSLADHQIDSYWMSGNHDVLEDGKGTTTLDLISAQHYGHGSHIVRDPCYFVVSEMHSHEFLFLPYTPTCKNYDPEQFVKKYKGCKPKLICSHLMIEGISVGSETEDFPRGRDVFLPIDTIKELFPKAIVVSGHYHQAQVFNGIHVVGSMVRLTRSEVNNTPRFLTLDI